MSSDEDGAALMASFKSGRPRAPSLKKKQAFSPSNFVSDQSSADEVAPQRTRPVRRKAVAVKVPPIRNKHEYTYYPPQEEVARILREFDKHGQLMYEVRMIDGVKKQITFEELMALENGPRVFQIFEHQDDGAGSESSEQPAKNMRLRNKTVYDGFVSVEGLDLSSDDDDEVVSKRSRQKRLRALRDSNSKSTTRSRRSKNVDSSDESASAGSGRRRRRKSIKEPTRRSSRSLANVQAYDQDEEEDEEEDEEGSSDIDILRSDIFAGRRKRKRGTGRLDSFVSRVPRVGTRQSERSTRTQNNMQEADINDIYRSDSDGKQSSAPKIISVKEVFETLPRSNLFRSRHVEGCEVCYDGPGLSPLIYCQGCSLAYHKNCLGKGASREHLVTKVSDEYYVLQCRRCINTYQKKDPSAPDLSMCQDCRQRGLACRPFKARKTPLQEQKDRDENNGKDPVVDVAPMLINNARNVLFRCTKCSRAYHYHHLPPLSKYAMDIVRDEEEAADERFQEYSKKWLCKECDETQNRNRKVSGLIAWRPSDVETYRPGIPCDRISEDEKQYLIKWEGESYFQAAWFSGAWTWGVTAAAMRKAFFKRENGPKMRTEDAIPEEFLRIDIVLDIKYTSHVQVRSEEIDKARIKEVDKALIKYKGLGYEDAVWEKVPTPEDGDRWLDFVTAYNDWVAGRYLRYPRQNHLKARLEKVRNAPFAKLEKQKQPESLVGGDLMKYQMDGLNWLYYQWYCQKNGILADEMGLGKTIQVIAFMAALIEEHNCFPFLVVVPNSTCANWRREIKQWVPGLRVVTFFGSAAARNLAKRYEMFPDGSKELRAHIVVTSYEAAIDDDCRRVFRSISWAALIVDEGQRLKNDKSQIYGALTTVKAPFRLLLTGTPLQNNARELFNLLQFLDETINAAELEEKYADMTSENVRELHDQIRPFILRRTKAQVLTFLPPLGQIIVPLSMSHLQKNLYKSILAKNPQLLKALFTSGTIKAQERANLNNLLMQLRKCLCHPFVYNREIEERTDIATVSHRNLVEASAKLQFLELLLPKLKERGHRVLIFSQFLDMLNIIEDFLDGMEMTYQRLDGTMGSLEKQKRIDQFNAPGSPLFAFLLSTRSGGVGINLATADTVIILDPDFNPHQDIQAISRAHRIGQKNKVLCFQLMTRASAEEKIVQVGRTKMALDHVVVEQLDAEDMEDKDVQSMLKFGAAELFKDDNADHDIRYDDASIEKLLDRSQIENTKTSGDGSAESQFSFARVWANDRSALEDSLNTGGEEAAPDPGVWDKILKERQAAAAAEALARAHALGRGKRARVTVDYTTEQDGVIDGAESPTASPVKVEKRRKKKGDDRSGNDTDFYAEESESEESIADEAQADALDLGEAGKGRRPSSATIINKTLYQQNGAGAFQKFRTQSNPQPTFPAMTLLDKGSPVKPSAAAQATSGRASGNRAAAQTPGIIDLADKTPPNKAAVKPFERVHLPVRSLAELAYGQHKPVFCHACHKQHPRGACQLKAAGVEHCGLCGLAHFGHARTCPHIKSETQVREMLEALKSSPEKKELVEAAIKYLRGVKGHLVQMKKKQKEKAMMGPGAGAPGQAVGTNRLSGAQPGNIYPGAAQDSWFAQAPAGMNQGPPQRVVPPAYNQYPMPAVLGSVGSYISGQAQRPPSQQLPTQQQWAAQGVNDAGYAMEDHEVESALRGFLGQ